LTVAAPRTMFLAAPWTPPTRRLPFPFLGAGGYRQIGAGEARSILDTVDRAVFENPACLGPRLDPARDFVLNLRARLSSAPEEGGDWTWPLSSAEEDIADAGSRCLPGAFRNAALPLAILAAAALLAFGLSS